MRCRVLVVEDEPSIAENLRYALQTEGFVCHRCATLAEADRAIEENPFDIILLDVGLPDGSGFDWCRELRRGRSVPVIFLTARSSEIDRVVGLELGGDDYVTKPFSPREITARIRAVMRRVNDHTPNLRLENADRSSPLIVDDERKRILFRGVVLPLSHCEFRLLCALAARPGRVFTRDELLERAWDQPEASLDRTVDAHVKSLRAKLRRVDETTDVIVTHRGLGYSLREDLTL